MVGRSRGRGPFATHFGPPHRRHRPQIRAGRLFAPSLAILLENLTTIELGLGDRYTITLWSTRR